MIHVTLKYASKDKTTAKELAVVVDVLRGSTTITTALQNGALWVMSTTGIEPAFKLAEKYNALLAGERNCLKINGFDFGNSPAEMTAEKVSGRRIVFTSTNFSGALAASMNSPAVVVGSMLNLTAVAEFSYKTAKENDCGICFMLAGNEDNNADEDLAFAGAACGILKDFHDCRISGDVEKAIDFVSKKGAKNCIKDSSHASRLMIFGLEGDVDFACKKDVFDIVPVLKDGKIIILR